MRSGYATYNQGEAAYLMTLGGEVVNLFKTEKTYDTKTYTRYFFEFNIDREAGLKAAQKYHDKVAQVEPYEFYGHILTLRSKMWKFRQEQEKLKNGEEQTSEVH